ncbi:hypothetical protein NON20_04795 [Synechocystis sp. B12]|nr:hypothetical protein NON20_04795 [Synechocystis sp. B12]
MTRRESANPEVTENSAVVPGQTVDFDIQQQLAELQELLYDSFHIPLTAWSVVDEEKSWTKLMSLLNLFQGRFIRRSPFWKGNSKFCRGRS